MWRVGFLDLNVVCRTGERIRAAVTSTPSIQLAHRNLLMRYLVSHLNFTSVIDHAFLYTTKAATNGYRFKSSSAASVPVSLPSYKRYRLQVVLRYISILRRERERVCLFMGKH